jgi:hypothetical protein
MHNTIDSSKNYSNGQSKLKERLKNEAPELYEALERSWTIAWNEWLPALGVRYDSYNSFPHLKNLEYYLDEVILGFETIDKRGTGFISPIELYVILNAILFHDIGHVTVSNGEEDDKYGSDNKKEQELNNSDALLVVKHKTNKDEKKKLTHAKESERIVKENWRNLGICSVEIAKSIAKICAFHDCDDETWKDQLKDLNNIVVDPYGEIRERWLGSILILIDHMDGAFTRVLPRYIQTGPMKVIGAFRNLIRGVYVDPACQMLRTVLGDDFSFEGTSTNRYDSHNSEKQKKVIPEELYCYKFNDKPSNKFLEETKNLFPRKGENNGIDYFDEDRTINYLSELKDSKFSEDSSIKICKSKLINKICGKEYIFSFSDWLVMKQVVYVKLKKPTCDWTSNKMLAMILGDIVENNLALSKIKEFLSENGITINAWVIDYQDHLYNTEGEETFEPIFSSNYLERVAKSMLKLSSSIINPGMFSYETLASDLRDPKIDRIKTAVRRIGIIFQEEKILWAGRDNWKWLYDGEKNKNGNKHKSIEEIESEFSKKIRNLPSPIM